MEEMLKQAKKLLVEGQYTCVVILGEHTYSSEERGVKPLLSWLEQGVSMKGGVAADKVVGKAAAYLYVLLGITELYAEVISDYAVEVFRRYNIQVTFDVKVPAIRNRTNTGLCPMETAVMEVDTPEEGMTAIKKTLCRLN